MLENEPTGTVGDSEPNEGSNQHDAAPQSEQHTTIEETTAKPARKATRRRAASRPAGPPEASADEETTPTGQPQPESDQPAADSAEATPRRRTRKKAVSAPDTSAESGDGGEESAPTTRRRTRKKAAAAPAAAESAEASGTEPGAGAAEPAAEEAPAKPKRRRRAASAPAGPPAAETEPVADAGDKNTAEEAEEQADVEQAITFAASEAEVREQIARRAPAMALIFQQPTIEDRPARPVETDTDELTAEGHRKRRRSRRRKDREGVEVEATSAAGDEREAAQARQHEATGHDTTRHDDAAEPRAADGDESAFAGEDDTDGGSSSSKRRRRRRRRATSTDVIEPHPDDPPNTVVKVREPRTKRAKRAEAPTDGDGVQSVKGSTRLEAKKQRRREGREQGRRRAPVITEAEFLARRESVERVMVVRQRGDRTQIGVLEDGVLVEHYVNRETSTSYVGNVYLGKVQNVLPSMEAAFVDIGKGRNAVLYAGEVNFDALGLDGGPKRIESVLKSGQSVLVQVTKDPIGHKGARLTSQVSLPGRYLVYVPEASMTGISRKLPDTERARLKQILKSVVPEDAGVIVRTAAEGASEEELRRDVERLAAQWQEIQRKSRSASAPSLLYGEPDLTVRVIRDIFNEDFSKLIVSGDEAYKTVHDYLTGVAPDLEPRLSHWTSDTDLFTVYRVDEQLAKALDRKVWLPSGGSLVIDRTEAMVVIDVNTGKFTGQGGNLEETVTRNNLEAAEEIVRQLRLRDLGGIIVVDFIDMVLESNRDLVLRRLLECLGRDRTKHQVAEVTSLGLVQMTRKRVGQGLLEAFSEVCDHCNGRGVIVHMEPVAAIARGKHAYAAHEEVHEKPAAIERQEQAAEAGAVAAEPAAEREPRHAEAPAEDDATRRRKRRRSRHTAEQRPEHRVTEPQTPAAAMPEAPAEPAKERPATAEPVTAEAETAAPEPSGDAAHAEPPRAEAPEPEQAQEMPVQPPTASYVRSADSGMAVPPARKRRATRRRVATAPAGPPRSYESAEHGEHAESAGGGSGAGGS
jgi:ribonuclease E